MAYGKDLGYLVTKDSFKPSAFYDSNPNEVFQIDRNLFYSEVNGRFFKDGEENIIPFISLKGVVMKDSEMCGPEGTSSIAKKMQMNDDKDNVSAHFIKVDSPGGAVDGTMEFASVVAGLTKPVVAFVDNMSASAAYWIASQASHIVTNSKNFTEIGSIGTLCILTNESEYLKKEGMKIEIMRASKSVDKARLNSIEEWPESSLEELQKELNTINTQFIKGVNTGRNGKLQTMGEDIFTGRMYDQKRALALGMIDQIGTLEDAIQVARKLSKSHKTTIK
jgi:protease-4